MEYKDFLLEITAEDLPVTYVRPALEDLKGAFTKRLEDLRISFGEIYVAGTKDKLICFVKDVSLKQEKVSQEVTGPSKRIAFDEKGIPTKQGLGFAKSQGVNASDLKIKKTEKGEYVVIKKSIKPKSTKDILQEIVPDIIRNIHFPKTMKWDESNFHFARPLNSVLLLFGKESLKIKIGKVPQKKVSSIEAKEYLKRLETKSLIYPEKRKEYIRALVLKGTKSLRVDSYIDEDLLEEVNFLVNSPVSFIGEFSELFLALPSEVLKASMSKYQRLFSVSKKGVIINKFIAVIDGKGRDLRSIRRNYENVLEARLKDSLFFFNEDTKVSLEEQAAQLKSLIFHQSLGTMFEKIERLKNICSLISDKLNLAGSIKSDIEKSAKLSKIDLVTHMVGEFPGLQGVIGAIYAVKSKENKKVAQAIKEHYLPKSLDDESPKNIEGSVLALSDRIDNIVGFLGMDEEVSGSFDPFGIRRNAQGIIQIIRDKSLRLNINELIEGAILLYGDKLTIHKDKLKNKILRFIKERISFLMGSAKPLELKEAVLEVGFSDIVDVFNRYEVLSSINKTSFFLETAKVVERTGNILKGAKKDAIGEVDESLFKDDLEGKVWAAYLNAKEGVIKLVKEEKYREATEQYGKLFFKVLHEFFDKVLVNVDDRVLRSNRLAMMKAINELYTERVADLAKLPQIIVK